MRSASYFKQAGFVCLCIYLVLAAAGAQAAPVQAKLTKISGTVTVKQTASAGWVQASEGMKVSKGAVVKSEADSHAFLAWNGNTVRIGPLSMLVVDELGDDGAGASNTKLNMTQGRIFAKTKKLASKETFEVKTPTAVCGVRGTAFEVTPDKVAVIEGTVMVQAGGAEQMVDAGSMVEITADGTPSEPVEIPGMLLQELKEYEKITGEIISEMMKELHGKDNEKDKGKGNDKDKGGQGNGNNAGSQADSQAETPVQPPVIDTTVLDIAVNTIEQLNIIDTVGDPPLPDPNICEVIGTIGN